MQIINGDCKEEMQRLLENGVRVDSIVTDPPYELGFMGKAWDKTGIAYDVEMWRLCFELLKPGGHLLSFGGSRTYHRMACAIEDAGFEIRDQIMWLYGQGFPKSLDISKQIDKMAGAERKISGYKPIAYSDSDCWGTPNKNSSGGKEDDTIYHARKGIAENGTMPIFEPATDDAKKYQGFGTALKPAHEPIVLARKPISEKTIAQNVLTHGTGAINIDGCRVECVQGDKGEWPITDRNKTREILHTYENHSQTNQATGRFPANIIHDGSDEVLDEFAKYGERDSGGPSRKSSGFYIKDYDESGKNVYGSGISVKGKIVAHQDKGTASRFFYCAKASKKDRNGSKHPTVKPIALMKYLCRLITPKNGIVLDPFAGTGTTGIAAHEEGFDPIMIESQDEYIKDIYARFTATNELYKEKDLFEDVCKQSSW